MISNPASVLATALAISSTIVLFSARGGIFLPIRVLLGQAAHGSFLAVFLLAACAASVYLGILYLLHWSVKVSEEFGSRSAVASAWLALRIGLAFAIPAACAALIVDAAVQLLADVTFRPPVVPSSFWGFLLLFSILVVFSAVVESLVLGLVYFSMERGGRQVGNSAVVFVSVVASAAHGIFNPIYALPTVFVLFCFFGRVWIAARKAGMGGKSAFVAIAWAHFFVNSIAIARALIPEAIGAA